MRTLFPIQASCLLISSFLATGALAADAAGTVPPVSPPVSELVQPAAASPVPDEQWSLHFQATGVVQAHPTFSAAYSGKNSMQPGAEGATSVLMDIYAGARLWKGAQFYLQPELAGGAGLSGTLGVASFPSGEVYRVGDPSPTVLLARVFLRQVFGLGGGRVTVDPGPNQLGGTQDRDALTLTIGKVSVPDFVDHVPVSWDPNTQFLSWGLFASGAYDYPADTRGYTWGIAADLTVDWWSVRAGMFLEPQYANLLPLEWRIDKARGLVSEFEGRYQIAGHEGAARLLLFLNDARMGSYQDALDSPSPNGPDVTASREFGRLKYGFAASANQDFGGGLTAFLRVSWDNGATETWAFTEIDRSVALGATQSGKPWGRPLDQLGVGIVGSGLSGLHRSYLASGGYGFIIGDGALNYGVEVLGEVYYMFSLTREIQFGVTYQPIFNPAYNQDRGPINVFTGRAHIAF